MYILLRSLSLMSRQQLLIRLRKRKFTANLMKSQATRPLFILVTVCQAANSAMRSPYSMRVLLFSKALMQPFLPMNTENTTSYGTHRHSIIPKLHNKFRKKATAGVLLLAVAFGIFIVITTTAAPCGLLLP